MLDEFVVTGVRASLINAQEIKQNNVQFVDSIVAQDIGKLPDNTVAEALQRVPGIQVARANGEVSTVVIRGLPNFGTTLNGHEIFTGTGRGVALQDLPAELIAGVDVYKSTTADQIEGGIAGLIDIRLRRPLDNFKGFGFGASARGVYGDGARKIGYVGSALVSNRWKFANGGEFGALFAVSHQRNRFQDFITFNFLFEPVPSTVTPGQPTIQLPATEGAQVIPGDRERNAYNLSLQWKPTSELEIYSDSLATTYRQDRNVHFFIGFPRFGVFQSAVLHPGTNIPISLISQDNFHLNSTQAFRDRTDSYQTVLGAKWRRDAVKVTTEVVYNWSSAKNSSVIVDTQFRPPTTPTYLYEFNKNGASNVTVTGADITDGDNYTLFGLFDNRGYQTSNQKAIKSDIEYTLSQGFLTKLQAGIRFTDREARSRQSAENNLEPVGGRGNVRTSTVQGFGIQTPKSKGNFGAAHWFGGNPDFQRDAVQVLRPLFGRPVTDPNFNPASAFNDEEKTYAAYGQVGYKVDLGNLPLDGVVGARVVQTKQAIGGFSTNGTPVTSSKKETEVLPVATARLKLQDNLQLRASASSTITRPFFADLNPVVSLQPATTTGGEFGTGVGGNPELESVKSDNYDLALEYYFARASYVSLGGFYRATEGYVQTFASIETIGGDGYIVTRPRNSGKGHLDGIEATYQQFFDALPEAFRGFGIQTNFTYIEGDQDVADNTPGAAVGSRISQAYAQVSKYNYNIVGIYERGPVSVRLAYNWRGKYVDTFDGPNAPGSPLRVITVKARGQLDFSASYKLSKNLLATVDIQNMLDSKYKDYFGPDASLYPRDTRLYDRTYAVGLRYTY